MTDDSGDKGRDARSTRNERLKSALRDNLKRRKQQARGRGGMAIVTPEDDIRVNEGTTGKAEGPHRGDG